MKNKKHLNFYKTNLQSGVIPWGGLCGSTDEGLLDECTLYLLSPTDNDIGDLAHEGLSTLYWGSGLPAILSDREKSLPFTELRQTIVLFMAAINNEL